MIPGEFDNDKKENDKKLFPTIKVMTPYVYYFFLYALKHII